ncbi:MAG TPA: zinc ABC transporter substrate-binding protein [Thermoanaerobaculia bacterium]|nr:zinc ABC transporter substrate-binding protein [Thermoanaerobaculia bacterium]
MRPNRSPDRARRRRRAAAGFAFSAVALAAALAVAAACAPAADSADDGRLTVVATTNLVADVVRRVAGEHAEVTALMGPGVDPHLYKASEGDVRRLSEADLIFYNGLHLEGKMADILVKMARGRPVVALGEAIPEGELREPPEFAGQYDPHVWFDVSLWALTPAVVAEELAAADAEHAEEYRANARVYAAELAVLDGWVRDEIATLAEERRVLITAHDAFGYFGRRYDVRVIGIQGISTLAEAGLQDVERVVDLVVESGVPAIFVESSVPRRTVEAVQAAVRARGRELAIGGELFSDSLGAEGTPEGTYPGMVRHNVETMVGALR